MAENPVFGRLRGDAWMPAETMRNNEVGGVWGRRGPCLNWAQPVAQLAERE